MCVAYYSQDFGNKETQMKKCNEKSDTPDSCHSWVIAASCNIIFFLVYGRLRIAGLLFAEIITSYNIDRQLASLPFVVQSSVRNFAGPVVGCLTEAMGFRPVIMMGSILSILGIGGCFFADNIVTICILYGLVCGIGDALTTSALPQIIYLYFEKHVSTATGFALTGAPIAGFVLSPVTAALLENFGLSGTFLMLAGIMLHALSVAIFLKEPKSTSSLSNLCCFWKKNKKTEKVMRGTKSSPSNYTVNESRSGIILNPNSLSQTYSNAEFYGIEGAYRLHYPIETLNSTMNVVFEENSLDISQPRNKAKEKKPIQWFNSFKILWNPAFLLISIPQCLYKLSYIIVPIVLVDFTKDKGIHESMGAYVLIGTSIGDLFGLVAFGWVTDRGFMTVAGCATLSFGITAVSFVSTVWPSTFSTLLTAVVFLGACLGAISTYSTRLVSEYIEKDKQTAAMTSISLLAGPVSLLVPSIIGYFRDDLGSYNYLMYSMSAVLLACSGLITFLPKIAHSKMTN